MTRGRERALRALACAAAALVAVAAAVRTSEVLVTSSIGTRRGGAAAPQSAPDVVRTDVSIPSGGRVLAGSYVPASAAPRGPLILIFEGNGEAVGDWSRAQAYLARQGFSSLGFDYTGFGRSAGRPTVEHLRQDALAAYRAALDLADPRTGVFVVAHSLGCNVALDAAPSLAPPPAGYALWGVTRSLRHLVTASGMLPAPLAFLLPAAWDNVRAAPAVHGPLLVLHGDDDQVVPEEDAVAVAAAAGASAVFAAVAGAGHNAPFLAPGDSNWGPILRFAATSGAGMAP